MMENFGKWFLLFNLFICFNSIIFSKKFNLISYFFKKYFNLCLLEGRGMWKRINAKESEKNIV